MLGWDPVRPPDGVAVCFAGRPLGDDTPVVAVPLALDTDEYRRVIRDGVAQRARALQAFFGDVFLGPGRFLGGVFGLTAPLLDEILATEGTSRDELQTWWRGHDVSSVRFVYGPDLARDAAGRWTVLEDNVGCVGGCADSALITDAYLGATGLTPQPARGPDLHVALHRWLGLMGLVPTAAGVVGLLSDSGWVHSCGPLVFAEDGRRRSLVEQLGVRVVADADIERLCGEPGALPPRALVNIGVPASEESWRFLRDVVFRRLRVPMLNAPGTSVLGNKALLPFVGDMIRHYCGEEPVLDTPATALLRDGVLPRDPARWVVKTAAGCQGSGVFVLRRLGEDRLTELAGALAGSWPTLGAVAQHHVEMSHVPIRGEPHFVEVRAIAYVVDWRQVVAPEQALVKVAPIHDPEVLNNLSRGGAYAPLLRVATTPDRAHGR
jgi:hypothetical protein